MSLFEAHSRNLHRYLDRLSGEPDLAADLVQEAFVRLYKRGSLPESPKAWLITVAMNLFRNARSTQTRRRRILTLVRGEWARSSPPSPEAAAEREEVRQRVRSVVGRLPERERQLLLMRAEGYSYRDIAAALQLNEASVGTLLARARREFLAIYEGGSDAPR